MPSDQGWEFVLYIGPFKEAEKKLNDVRKKFAIKVISIQPVDKDNVFVHMVKKERDQNFDNSKF